MVYDIYQSQTRFRRSLQLFDTELTHYSDDGANIMINNGWMEQPPETDDRKTLAKRKG
jgi:hypothetical protein